METRDRTGFNRMDGNEAHHALLTTGKEDIVANQILES